MPKQKHLNVRYTIRLSDYLSNEMVKHTLNSGQDYSSFIRMCISNYLKNSTQNSNTSDILQVHNESMSAVKTDISGVIDDLPNADMFGRKTRENTAPTFDDDTPCSPSLYGWD